jgi:hypothetical protein
MFGFSNEVVMDLLKYSIQSEQLTIDEFYEFFCRVAYQAFAHHVGF